MIAVGSEYSIRSVLVGAFLGRFIHQEGRAITWAFGNRQWGEKKCRYHGLVVNHDGPLSALMYCRFIDSSNVFQAVLIKSSSIKTKGEKRVLYTHLYLPTKIRRYDVINIFRNLLISSSEIY